jgi:hypothetical protein
MAGLEEKGAILPAAWQTFLMRPPMWTSGPQKPGPHRFTTLAHIPGLAQGITFRKKFARKICFAEFALSR